jgi:hypothetical protein
MFSGFFEYVFSFHEALSRIAVDSPSDFLGHSAYKDTLCSRPAYLCCRLSLGTRLAVICGDAPAGDTEVLWIDRPSRRLRVLEREEISTSAITRSSHGVPFYLTADGHRVPGLTFPPWGIPGVCIVLELRTAGHWSVAARRATKYGAGDTPGFDVVDKFRHERGASQLSVLESYTYVHQIIAGRSFHSTPQKFAARLRAAGPYSVEDFSYTSFEGVNCDLIFQVIEGDTVHASEPLFFAKEPNAELARVKLSRSLDQIGFTQNGHLLLIAEEYSGDHPTVIDLRTGLLSIDSGQSAVWIP